MTKFRALFLSDDRYGANWSIEDGLPSIARNFLSFGWAVETASVSGIVRPCAWAGSHGLESFVTDRRIAEITDIGEYDLLAILPGQAYDSILAEPAALELIRGAERAGLAIGAFCRGSRVLARAGVLSGRRMTGHADYEEEYKAAGALYIGYADRAGKSDAPPPVVDGNLVTSMRSNYYRGLACEAMRIAAENAHAVRGPRSCATAAPARAAAAPSSSAVAPARAPEPSPEPAKSLATAPIEGTAFAIPLARGDERSALALVRSIRDFGGALARSRIIVLTPNEGEKPDARAFARLSESGVEQRAFAVPPSVAAIPFAKLPFAAAEAERWAEGRADLLVWMAPDALVLREPSEVLLPPGAVLGFRPVHHAMIGSKIEDELDEYWTAIYEACGADPKMSFPVISTIDRRRLRFYPNAGFLALRPEARILRSWEVNFARSVLAPRVASTFAADRRRIVFAHQAFLAATALALLPRSTCRELSFAYNYPLHMHASCPPHLAPRALADLVVARYDEWSRFPRPIDSSSGDGSSSDGISNASSMGAGSTNGLAIDSALTAWLAACVKGD